jgi:hypothetical protein
LNLTLTLVEKFLFYLAEKKEKKQKNPPPVPENPLKRMSQIPKAHDKDMEKPPPIPPNPHNKAGVAKLEIGNFKLKFLYLHLYFMQN